MWQQILLKWLLLFSWIPLLTPFFLQPSSVYSSRSINLVCGSNSLSAPLVAVRQLPLESIIELLPLKIQTTYPSRERRQTAFYNLRDLSNPGIIGSLGWLRIEAGQSNDLNITWSDTPACKPLSMSLVWPGSFGRRNFSSASSLMSASLHQRFRWDSISFPVQCRMLSRKFPSLHSTFSEEHPWRAHVMWEQIF